MQRGAMAFIRHDLPAGSLFLPSFSPPAPRSHAGSLAQRCHQTKESGPECSEREMERETWQKSERERQRTPGTTLAAVWVDIQGWLIYGAGESVSLLWVLDRTGQTGLLAAASPPTLLVTTFYHCRVAESPSTARLSRVSIPI